MGSLSCPGCRSYYTFSPSLAPTTRFQCPSCGFAGQLGQIVGSGAAGPFPTSPPDGGAPPAGRAGDGPAHAPLPGEAPPGAPPPGAAPPAGGAPGTAQAGPPGIPGGPPPPGPPGAPGPGPGPAPAAGPWGAELPQLAPSAHGPPPASGGPAAAPPGSAPPGGGPGQAPAEAVEVPVEVVREPDGAEEVVEVVPVEVVEETPLDLARGEPGRGRAPGAGAPSGGSPGEGGAGGLDLLPTEDDEAEPEDAGADDEDEAADDDEADDDEDARFVPGGRAEPSEPIPREILIAGGVGVLVLGAGLFLAFGPSGDSGSDARASASPTPPFPAPTGRPSPDRSASAEPATGERPSPSPTPSPAEEPGERFEGTVAAEGDPDGELPYHVYVPAPKPGERFPALVCAPSQNLDPSQLTHDRWADFADEERFALVVPGFRIDRQGFQARTSFQFPKVWSGDAVDRILSAVAARAPVDPSSLYLLGLADGANFAARYAFLEHERVRAVVVHGSGGFPTPPDTGIETAFYVSAQKGSPQHREINEGFAEEARQLGIGVRLELEPGDSTLLDDDFYGPRLDFLAAARRGEQVVERPEPTREPPPASEDGGEAGDAAAFAPPEREEPPERAARFEEAAAAGRERVATLRERIQREEQALEEARAAEVARAREASTEDPLEVPLAPGFTLDDAVVVDFDERSFRLRSGPDDVSYEWDAVDPRVALRIRRLAVRDDVGEDHERLGYWLLRRRRYTLARRAFRKAVRLDPEVEGRTPDVDALAKAARVFSGDLERSGSSVEVRYTFDDASEADDWRPYTRGTAYDVRDGSLLVQGSGVYVVALKEVGFDGRVEIHARVDGASRRSAAVFGLGFGMGTEEESLYLAAAFPETRSIALFHQKGRSFEVLDRERGALSGDRPMVRMRVRDGRIEVIAREKITEPIEGDPTWDDVGILAGGSSQGGRGTAELGDLEVAGRVRYAWLRKSFGHLDALLQGILARAEELPVFSAGPSEPPERALSAEDAFGLEGVAEEAVERYREAKGALTGETKDPRALIDAANDLGSVLRDEPYFAAALYLRGRLLAAAGGLKPALRDLRRATECCPRFYEARAAYAQALANAGRHEEALEAAEAAIETRPGYAPAYAARGLVHFYRRDLEAAGSDLQLARALAPWDPELRTLSRNVHHVLEGPPWTKPRTVETEHYVVETNVPTGVAQYARNLEAVRAYYLESFGLDALPGGDGRSSVLLFDTEEGYHSYADLSMDDRVEWTLGCYVPRYRQLLLFEDKNDAFGEETRHTLYHEGFHQFMHQLVGDDAVVPFWLNEGLAEYFAACRVEGGEVVETGRVLDGRLRHLRLFLEQNRRPLAFERLMQETPAEFYSGPVGVKYAQAWAMVHYLEEEARPAVRERFERYVDRIREGVTGEEAFEAAWEGVDWDALEDRWVRFVRRM